MNNWHNRLCFFDFEVHVLQYKLKILISWIMLISATKYQNYKINLNKITFMLYEFKLILHGFDPRIFIWSIL